MNFQLRSDRYEKRKIPYIKFCISLFVFLFIIQLVFPKILPAFFARTFLPLFPLKLDNRDQIIEELKSQISNNQSSTTVDIVEERIKANVIKLPPFTPYDSLVIDKGLSSGVNVDDLVQISNITIGRIKESYADYSRVEILSSPNKEIEVRIGSSSIPSTAFGRGAGNFEVLYPRESPIQKGDQVIIPEISPEIYSYVSEVISDPANPFIAIIFTNPIPLQSISYVYIKKR